MAIFTNKNDADIPYLTSFYQVDAVQPDSVQEMMQSEMVEYLRRDWKQHNVEVISGEPFRLHQSQVAPYFLLHTAVTAVMDAMADLSERGLNTPVDVADLLYLQDRMRYLANRELMVTPRFLERNQFGGLVWVPLEEQEQKTVGIDFVVVELAQDHHLYTEKRILDEMRNLLVVHPPVRRCEECFNPFVLYKKGRIFCSHRCAARAGARQRRAFEKDIL